MTPLAPPPIPAGRTPGWNQTVPTALELMPEIIPRAWSGLNTGIPS